MTKHGLFIGCAMVTYADTPDKIEPGPPIELPVDAVTTVTVIFGKRGSGKSNAGVVLAEEVIKAGSRFSVMDPVDHWYGIKARPDGTPGFPVYVFGGQHGDLPLEPTAGALMAQVVAESPASIVLCTVEFSGAERARFVTDYSTTLLKLMLSRKYAPLMQIFEEADSFAPQRPMPGEQRMLGAVDKLVRQVRQGGGGLVLITQRSAALNKNVTTQADTLVAFRTIGPQDRNAIDEWVKFHDAGARRQEVLETLATLKDGESWFWSPEKFDLFCRLQWRRRETFDAASTPKVGEKVFQPTLATVDLEQLRVRMAATIERAKADDPKALRKRITELEQAALKASHSVSTIMSPPVEVPVITEKQMADLERQVSALLTCEGMLETLWEKVSHTRADIVAAMERVAGTKRAIATAPAPDPPRPRGAASELTQSRRQRVAESDPNGRAISKPQQKLLDTLAELESIRVTQPAKTQLALFAGVSPTSGTFFNNLGALRTAGLIDYPAGGRVALTAAGRDKAEIPFGEALTTAEMHSWVERMVGATKWRIVKALIDIYPEAIGKTELAERIGVSPTSGSYFNNLGALRSLGLIGYPSKGEAAAEAVLFVV